MKCVTLPPSGTLVVHQICHRWQRETSSFRPRELRELRPVVHQERLQERQKRSRPHWRDNQDSFPSAQYTAGAGKHTCGKSAWGLSGLGVYNRRQRPRTCWARAVQSPALARPRILSRWRYDHRWRSRAHTRWQAFAAWALGTVNTADRTIISWQGQYKLLTVAHSCK